MASFQAFGIFLLLVFTASLCHAIQEGNFKININVLFQLYKYTVWTVNIVTKEAIKPKVPLLY